MKSSSVHGRIHSHAANRTLLWFPVFSIIVILPLIIYPVAYQSRLSDFAWTPVNSDSLDLYLFAKQTVFVALALLCFLLGIYLLQTRRQNKNLSGSHKLSYNGENDWAILIPLGVYLFFAILSAVFSEYKYAVFTGSDAQFESIFALVGYAVFACYLLLLLDNEKTLCWMLLFLGMLMTLLSLLAFLQYTGNEPLQWEWFRDVLGLVPLDESFPLSTWAAQGFVSLFSYNPNYAGVLLSMLSVFCFVMLFTEKNWKYLFAETFLLLALSFSLLGTGSKAGLLTFAAVGIASLFFLRKRIKKLFQSKYRYITSLLLVVFTIAIGTFLFLNNRGASLWTQLQQALTFEKSEPNPLQAMQTKADEVCFIYRGISFSVSFDYIDGIFDFTVLEYPSGDGSLAEEMPLMLSEDRKCYYLGRDGLDDVFIKPGIINDVLPLFSIFLNEREWMFIRLEEQEQHFFYLNEYLKIEELGEIQRFGFVGHENFATGRGLIWSMTLPLLKDRLLLGSGANTFAFVYPQNNYKDLYYYIGEVNASTRPHSMYLQIAVESGIPALIALLIFFAWYLIQSLRLYWKSNFGTLTERIGLACFLSIAVYLVCGLTNDSMITVAPVFWGIMGMGMAVNRMATDSKNGKQN